MRYSLTHLYTLLVLALFLTACGGYQTSPSIYRQQPTDMNGFGKKAESDLEGERFKQERKIVKNARMELVVTEPDSIFKDLNVVAQLNEGYISASASAYAALTVKSAHLERTLEMLGKLGKVKSQSISTKDITAHYTDFKVRLDNAEKARKRYLELMKKAERVDEVLPIEKEVERLTEKIERMKGQLRVMEHQISYSRIDVSWQKKTKPGPIGYVFVGLFKAVKVLFVRN